MAESKPRRPADALYALLRDERWEDFNRSLRGGATCDLRGCDLRGIDLRAADLQGIDLSDCYFRQADLRGLDLRKSKLEGASLHAAHISGVYFPKELSAPEIDMSVRFGTRLRYT